jgi:hypothetical protein
VAHFGRELRVTTKDGADPGGIVRAALPGAGVRVLAEHEARLGVEDAFVAMVHEDEAREARS